MSKDSVGTFVDGGPASCVQEGHRLSEESSIGCTTSWLFVHHVSLEIINDFGTGSSTVSDEWMEI